MKTIVAVLGMSLLTSLAQAGDAHPRVKIVAPRPRIAVPVDSNFRVVGKAFHTDRVKRIEVRVGRRTFRAEGLKHWRASVIAPALDGRFTISARALDRRGRVIAERAIHANAIDIFAN